MVGSSVVIPISNGLMSAVILEIKEILSFFI